MDSISCRILIDGNLDGMSEFLKRGPIPAWRVAFWVCVAAIGVFWFGSDHSWRMGLFASLFCAVVMGGFFFTLNWVAGDRGQVWSRKNARLLRFIFVIALAANTIMKLLDIVEHWK
jgi:hypothetical protein